MSTKWSYSGDPSSSQLDAVRFQIGDTEPKDTVFTNAEINYILGREGSVNEAALALARAAMAKYARLVTSAAGDERKDLSTRLDQFQKLVKQLEMQRSKRVTGIFAGGISRSDKCTQENDSDRVKPAMSRNMHDVPGNPFSSSDEGVD